MKQTVQVLMQHPTSCNMAIDNQPSFLCYFMVGTLVWILATTIVEIAQDGLKLTVLTGTSIFINSLQLYVLYQNCKQGKDWRGFGLSVLVGLVLQPVLLAVLVPFQG